MEVHDDGADVACEVDAAPDGGGPRRVHRVCCDRRVNTAAQVGVGRGAAQFLAGCAVGVLLAPTGPALVAEPLEGAKAVHLEKEIGSLEPSKKADLILINLSEPNAVPMYDVYSQLAYALKASDVDTVVIGGRIVMRDHKLLTLRETEILAKAREYGKKVEASLK